MSRADLDEIARLRAEHATTDLGLLGDVVWESDRGEGYLQGDEYYAWYHAVARHVRPRGIGEIGVRLGYSLKAMLLGSIAGGVDRSEIELHGFDNECYHPGSLAYCEGYFGGSMGFPNFHAHRLDTQGVEDLGVGPLDLVHVDGDHSEAGAYHDLGLAFKAVAPGGVILVDDVMDRGPTTVTAAADRFCRERGLEPTLIPHCKGLYFIRVQ